MPTVLETLLAPIGRDEFRERHYGKQPLLVQGQADKFAGLFTWDALNRLLNASPWPHPHVQVSPRYVSPDSAQSAIEQVRAGAALIFNQIHLFDPQIAGVTRSIEAETGEPTNAVLFLSQPAQAAAPLHYDRHDVFVLHLHGRKAWSVYDRTIDKPVYELGDVPGDPPAAPMFECELSPGDVLYIPRGHWHQALAQNGLSVHLTFGLQARTGIDFLQWLVGELRNDVRLRDELPLTFRDEPADDRLRDHVAEIRDVVLSRLNDPQTIASFVQHCVVSHADAQPFKFPVQLLDAPGTALAVTRFSRPAHQRVLVTDGPTADRITVTVWGNVLYFRAAARPLIELLVSQTTFTLGEALAHAGELTREDVWGVLNPLLQEGILEAVP
jgi:ribosomal protein L16 Arg81 hydroxylase